jgi:hypothetical protein
MKVLYDSTGKIFYAVYDREYFKFSHTTNIPLSILTIDEVDANKDICIDLIKNVNKVNADGLGKHYIQDGELYYRDGWAERIEEDING